MKPRRAQEDHTHAGFAVVRGSDDVFMYATGWGGGLYAGVNPFSGTAQNPATTGTRVEQSHRYIQKPLATPNGWLGSATAPVFLGDEGMDISFMFGGEDLLTGTLAYKQLHWVGLRNSTSHVALDTGEPEDTAFDGYGFGTDYCIPAGRPDSYTTTDVTTWNTVSAASWNGADLEVTTRSGTINTMMGVAAFADGTCEAVGFSGRTGTTATTYSFPATNSFGSALAAVKMMYLPGVTAYTPGNNWVYSTENADLGWVHCASMVSSMGTSNNVNWTPGPELGGTFYPSQLGVWYATESSGPADPPVRTDTTMRFELGHVYQATFHQEPGASTVEAQLTDVNTGVSVSQVFTARTDALNPMVSTRAVASTSGYPYVLSQLSFRALLRYSE